MMCAPYLISPIAWQSHTRLYKLLQGTHIASSDGRMEGHISKAHCSVLCL